MKRIRLPAITIITLLILALIAMAPGLRLVSIASATPITITTAYTTAYTWFDNTPPGSGNICCPIVHQTAAGTGTYADPITLAVGHSTASGHDVLDFPPGTRFYMYDVRRYFIVEDSCGGSSPPESGGCHSLGNAPAGATVWVDMWAGGTASDTQTVAQSCSSMLTDGDGSLHTIVENPPADLVVVSGPLFQNGLCTALYGNNPPPTQPPASPPSSTPTPTPTPHNQSPTPPSPTVTPTTPSQDTLATNVSSSVNQATGNASNSVSSALVNLAKPVGGGADFFGVGQITKAVSSNRANTQNQMHVELLIISVMGGFALAFIPALFVMRILVNSGLFIKPVSWIILIRNRLLIGLGNHIAS